MKVFLKHLPAMVALVLSLSVLPANAAQAAEKSMLILGNGSEACSTWVTPADEAARMAGEIWLLGFWTGLNVMNRGNHNVGKGIDPKDILEEMRQVCTEDQTRSLVVAATAVYQKHLASTP